MKLETCLVPIQTWAANSPLWFLASKKKCSVPNGHTKISVFLSRCLFLLVPCYMKLFNGFLFAVLVYNLCVFSPSYKQPKNDPHGHWHPGWGLHPMYNCITQPLWCSSSPKVSIPSPPDDRCGSETWLEVLEAT